MRSLTRYAEKAKELGKKIPQLYKLGAQSYIDRRFPRHIFIETTAKCNLTCNYCPREDDNTHMEFELFKSIVNEAAGHGPRSFSLHLFGEPLLWPHILEGIKYIKQRNRRNVVLLTTNGTHLNRFAKGLIDSGVDEIIWSWRREARFRDDTVQLLQRATLSGKTVFRVRILKEVTPKEELERWKTWPKVEIRNLHNYGGEVDLSQYGVPNAPKRWPCYHLWYAPAVAANGNMLLCCVDPHQRYVLGNVKDQSIETMWKSPKVIAERMRQMRGEYGRICKDCDVWKNYPNIFFDWQRKSQ